MIEGVNPWPGLEPVTAPDHMREAIADYRAKQDRQNMAAPGNRSKLRGVDRGDAVGMDDVPLPPVDAYADKGQSADDKSVVFALIRASEMESREPEYLVEDIVETSALALAFGDPGCGKSFFAIDMAACVAIGTSFHGRKVKQGAVIYIAGEGHNGLKRRLTAWERHWGVNLASAPLYFSKVAASFLDSASALAVAHAVDTVAAREGSPVMIVVDTLARNFGAGDENQTADMNTFVCALDDLKERYPGCTVLVIHHTGHTDKQRGRGSMSLKGALDTEYRVEKVGDTITVTATKMKDAPEPPPLAFTLMPIELGTTSKGKPITSAVLVAADAPPQAKPGRLKPSLKLALDSFHAAKRRAGLANDLGASIHVEDWRVAFYELSTADSQHAKKMAFQRARAALVDGGDLSVFDDQYRLARLPE